MVACVCVWRQPLLPPFLPYPSANSTPPPTHTPNCTPRSLTQHTPHPLAPVDPNLTLPPPVPRLLPPQARVEALRGKLERTRSTSEGLRAAHAELAHSAQKVAHAERKLQDHQAAAAAAAGGKVGGPHGRVGAGGEGGGEGAFRPDPPRPPPKTHPPTYRSAPPLLCSWTLQAGGAKPSGGAGSKVNSAALKAVKEELRCATELMAAASVRVEQVPSGRVGVGRQSGGLEVNSPQRPVQTAAGPRGCGVPQLPMPSDWALLNATTTPRFRHCRWSRCATC